MAQGPITASMLYDFKRCEHRVYLDLFEDPSHKDETDPFVELLWKNGRRIEDEKIAMLDVPFVHLKNRSPEDRGWLTARAMAERAPLIYGGRIHAADLLGEPDLLRWDGSGYLPGDIKSGSAFDDRRDESKLKKHYAVQLALYADILRTNGVLGGGHPFVWDVDDREVPFDLGLARGKRKPYTLAGTYREALAGVRAIVSGRAVTIPAIGGECKDCCWGSWCRRWAEREDDLTLIYYLGRSKRDAMKARFGTVAGLAGADISGYLGRKGTGIEDVGPATLATFQARARMQKEEEPKPYFLEPVDFPGDEMELFFDVETDPTQDLCYLHGFVERRRSDPASERYVSFFADRPEQEEETFADAWRYLADSGASAIYHFSDYEVTTWKRLARRYPGVASEEDVEQRLAKPRRVDLYKDVAEGMIWPTSSYSVKSLAKFLGFRWRDPNPSGAASIRWFNEWTETGDAKWKQRILDYNEDDCRAMRVLLDAVKAMPVRPLEPAAERPRGAGIKASAALRSPSSPGAPRTRRSPAKGRRR